MKRVLLFAILIAGTATAAFANLEKNDPTPGDSTQTKNMETIQNNFDTLQEKQLDSAGIGKCSSCVVISFKS